MMNVVILAAGRGTRMKSDLPKVLVPMLGKPLIEHLLDSLIQLPELHLLAVVGYQKEKVESLLKRYPVQTVVQAEQLGTGHAVQQAVPFLRQDYPETLVLCGDMPLIQPETLRKLKAEHCKNEAKATVLTAPFDDPGHYGRIVRGPEGEVLKIVEFKDASDEEKKIQEINSGTYIFDTQILIQSLGQLKAHNAQKEYYLTDTLEIIRKQGHRISAYSTLHAAEISGINTEEDLKLLEKQAQALLLK